MKPSTSCFMNNATCNLMFNIAHKISCWCEYIGQGILSTTPPILLHLLLSFLSSLSPSPPSILLPFCASILFLIAPFIKEYKYFFPVCCISGCLFFFFCQLSGGHSPFCSAPFLAACLVLLYPQRFSLISHQHYSWPR